MAGLSAHQQALVSGWAVHGWPVVVRRPAPEDAASRIPIGIPLPPSAGKLRVALSLAATTPIIRRPPVNLRDTINVAPPTWRDTIAALDRLGVRLGARPCIYGALLWQTLTGLTYLSAGSDLDLLWRSARSERAALLDGLRTIAVTAPMALDGELLLEEGGVNWRELDRVRTTPGAEVVIKAMSGTSLQRVDAILEDRERSDRC